MFRHLILILALGMAGFSSSLAFAQDLVITPEIRDVLRWMEAEGVDINVWTASKHGQSMADAPAAISVVTAEDIQHYGWRNLAEVIKAQPGFDVYSDRIYNYIVPRGFALSNDPNSRILLLVDGHSVVEFFGYYNGHLASVDLNYVSRIEFVRGPNSALYGTNAMFAVINVMTKKGDQQNGLHLINELGSFQHTKFSLAYGKQYQNGLNVFVQGTGLRTDHQTLFFKEYDNPDYSSGGFTGGNANELDLRNGSFNLSYKNLSLHGMANNRKKHIPTGLYGGRFNDEATFFRISIVLSS